MTALALVTAETEYGTDIAATTDTAPVWGIASGTVNLAYALIRRLGTPRGALFYDPDYGTDLRAYVNRRVNSAITNRLPSDISAECDKDERVQSTSATVSFSSQTRVMTTAILVEPIVGETFSLVLAATAVTVDLLSINGVALSATTPTVAAGTQFLLGPSGKDGKDGAAGPAGPAGAGGTPQVYLDFDAEWLDSSSGIEDVVYQRYINFGPLPATLTAEIGGRVFSSAGSAVIRLRVGGTADTADGSIATSITTTANTPTPATASNSGFTNPTGWQLVKLTIQSSGAGQSGNILNPTGSFR